MTHEPDLVNDRLRVDPFIRWEHGQKIIGQRPWHLAEPECRDPPTWLCLVNDSSDLTRVPFDVSSSNYVAEPGRPQLKSPRVVGPARDDRPRPFYGQYASSRQASRHPARQISQ